MSKSFSFTDLHDQWFQTEDENRFSCKSLNNASYACHSINQVWDDNTNSKCMVCHWLNFTDELECMRWISKMWSYLATVANDNNNKLIEENIHDTLQEINSWLKLSTISEHLKSFRKKKKNEPVEITLAHEKWKEFYLIPKFTTKVDIPLNKETKSKFTRLAEKVTFRWDFKLHKLTIKSYHLCLVSFFKFYLFNPILSLKNHIILIIHVPTFIDWKKKKNL